MEKLKIKYIRHFWGGIIVLVLFVAIIFTHVSFARSETFIPSPPISQPVEEIGLPHATSDGNIFVPMESLPAPKILSPKNGKVVSGPTVSLKWTPVKGAKEYLYSLSYRSPGQIDCIGAGVPAGSSSGTSAQFDLPEMPHETTVCWNVYGVSEHVGQGAAVSEEAEFVYRKSKKQQQGTAKNAAEFNTLKKKIGVCEQKSSFDAIKKCLKPLGQKISKACKKTRQDCRYLDIWVKNIQRLGVSNGLSIQDLTGNIILGIDNVLQGKSSGPVFSPEGKLLTPPE